MQVHILVKHYGREGGYEILKASTDFAAMKELEAILDEEGIARYNLHSIDIDVKETT